MKKILLLIFFCLLLFGSCKKETTSTVNQNNQLYPLAVGNVWIYVDSFFNIYGDYIGNDTFRLKTAETIYQNNKGYTPITDQYDYPIFTVRSDDSTVFILEPPGEALLFMWPLATDQPYINNSYYGDTLTSLINTTINNTTNYPSYKIVVTYDNGLWPDYKQEEFYFTKGKGIIKGRDVWKNYQGDTYVSDAYTLISYSLH